MLSALFIQAAEVPKEYQVKAAFLYNFTKFVEWPAGTHAQTNSPLIIGVFGKNPFGAELEHAVVGRQAQGRKVVAQPVETVDAARKTHLLFVGPAEDSRLTELAAALKGLPVLTVGQTDLFSQKGGVIRFVLEGDKVRFDINMDAAEETGLKISAQLQKLARKVNKGN